MQPDEATEAAILEVLDEYLAQPDEGVGSGFKYQQVPHITLGSIANSEPPAEEILYNKAYGNDGTKAVQGASRRR